MRFIFVKTSEGYVNCSWSTVNLTLHCPRLEDKRYLSIREFSHTRTYSQMPNSTNMELTHLSIIDSLRTSLMGLLSHPQSG